MRIASFSLFFLTLALGGYGCGSGGDNGGGDAGDLFEIRIESITPDHGPLSGGTQVTVIGSGFTAPGADGNTFLVGPSTAQVNVISDTEAHLITPAATSEGLTDVTVINGNGAFSLGDVFSYNPEPVIVGISPESGTFRGGTVVTLTGSGFTNLEAGTNSVLFDDQPGTEVEVVSDTEIRATSPTGAPYTRSDVSVRNANGVATLGEAYVFTSDAFLAFRNRSNPLSLAEEGEVLHVDPVTETSEVIFAAPFEGGRIVSAVRDGDDVIYFTQQSTAFRLASTGERTNLGQITGCPRITSVVFHQGTLFALCRQGSPSSFGTVDLAALTFNPIGINNDCCALNIASDGTNLYRLRDSELTTINPATGNVLSTISTTAPRSRGLLFIDGKLLALSRGFSGGGGGQVNFLFEIDPTTGISTALFQAGVDLHGIAAAF